MVLECRWSIADPVITALRATSAWKGNPGYMLQPLLILTALT